MVFAQINRQRQKVDNFIRILSRFIFDLVFPIGCLNCNKEGVHFCSDCQTKLKKIDKQKCLVCRSPSPFGKTHPGCASRNKIDGVVSALSYQDALVKKIIAVFKYKFIEQLSQILAESLADQISQQGLTEYFHDFVLVPVPLHKRRLNWRGFNQSELLADSLTKILNLKLSKNMVTRQKHTIPQTKLSANEREKNLTDAFGGGLESPAGKKILLVDDVVTTGATLNELAKLLKKMKATEVWAITVGHG
ncbi:MAG: ComF family protein [bacterium]|nr:ComF family protein [bacterium]